MSEKEIFNPVPLLVEQLGLPFAGVEAVVKLLAEGSTVPFIARYRKEVTGGLDEVQIRNIEERRAYLMELEARRTTILKSIEEQGKLTDELRVKILATGSKTELEDLYLPYKPKRRTRATIAREKGLEPLALRILEQPADGSPKDEATGFISEEKGVNDLEEALQGARDIVAETMAEKAEIRSLTRDTFNKDGELKSEGVPDKIKEPTKFEDYYSFDEAVSTIPSHRFLALRRGEREGILRVKIGVDAERLIPIIEKHMDINPASPFADQMHLAIEEGFKRLLSPGIETDVRVDLKMRSDRDAVDIFANNLRSLLLAAPLGTKSMIGIDPGLRTGSKCVAVDATGKYLDTVTLYTARGENEAKKAKDIFLAFVQRFKPQAIAVGNGTGGREIERFVKQALKEVGVKDINIISVNEAGASIYSASDVAREEFPDLDLTIRGSISIARRLQDPLAELVKIEPKAIGVGQYQHDVHQPLLVRKLGEVVESCVNHVGVELNTASAPLLSYVAGIGPAVAKKIVAHREETGRFESRKALMKVPGLGKRTYEQAAGFLRVHNGTHPLDSSAVHPERYKLVEQIAKDMGITLEELVGDTEKARAIDIKKYVGEGVGEPTLRDIVAELQKPGRDPRATFEAPAFRDDVMEMSDLKEGMSLEGVVTNVTAFGAFVDIGVHQDGLVHISQLADRFVKDPNEVVKTGDKLKVRVMAVDLPRKRISLTAKTQDAPQKVAGPPKERSAGSGDKRGDRKQGHKRGGRPQQEERPARGHVSSGFSNNPFAAALSKNKR